MKGVWDCGEGWRRGLGADGLKVSFFFFGSLFELAHVLKSWLSKAERHLIDHQTAHGTWLERLARTHT